MSFLKIKENEYLSTFYGFMYSFIIVGFFIVTKSFRDSLFLNNFTKSDLSYIYLFTPIISGLLVWITLLAVKKKTLFKKSLLTHLVICVISIILLNHLSPASIVIYYIFVEFHIGLIAIVFWDVLSESFNNRQAKRLFTIITSGGFLSALIVGSTLPILSKYFSQTNYVIFFNLFILICPIFVYKITNHSTNPNVQQGSNDDSKNILKDLLHNKYIVNIVFITLLFTIITVFVDYNFKVIAFSKFQNDLIGLTNFFAQFYSITSFISFIIQISLSGYLISKYGIKYSLMIMPMLLFLSIFFGFFLSPFLLILIMKGKDQIFKATLHDTSMHILWMPVPTFKRIILKPFTNIFLKSIFSVIAATLLIVSVLLNFTLFHFIPVLLLLLSLLLILMNRTKTLYIEQLIKAIDNRSLNLDDAQNKYLINDNGMISIVKNKILSEKKNRYFILKLLDENIILSCKDALREVYIDSDIETQKFILKYFINDDETVPSEILLKQLNEGESIATSCLDALCQRNVDGIENINNKLSLSNNYHLKYKSLNNAIKYNFTNKDKALNTLSNDIMNKKHLKYIISHISHSQYNFLNKELLIMIENIESDDMINYLKFCNKDNIDNILLDKIIKILSSKSLLAISVSTFFKKLNSDFLNKYFIDILINSKSTVKVKKYICQLICVLKEPTHFNLYEEIIAGKNQNYSIIECVYDSMIELKYNDNQLFHFNEHNDALLEEIIYTSYYYNTILNLLNNDKNDRYFLKEYFSNKIIDLSRIMMKIIYFNEETLFNKKLSMSIFNKNVINANIIELFEECLDDNLRRKIIPLIDSIPTIDKCNNGIHYYNKLKSVTLDNLFDQSLLYKHEWFTFLMIKDVYMKDLTLIDKEKIIFNRYFKIILDELNFNVRSIDDISQNKTVYSRMITKLEKTLYLKDSSIFDEIPAKDLYDISHYLEEKDFSKNDYIFKDGDDGDSMYFILSGDIDIMKVNTKLVSLRKGEYFGEMALLDGETRSADAICTQDSILLKLKSNDFNRIMYSNEKIVKGILKMLSQRLRKANQLIHKKR